MIWNDDYLQTQWLQGRGEEYNNKNVTNLHIWQWKIVVLHALHVHFSFLDISQTFSFFQRRETTCFAIVQFCPLTSEALVPI